MTRKAQSAILVACLLAGGCTSQSKYAQRPVWVSGAINGLQQSRCNCGGIEPKKHFKARRKAEAAMQRNNDGND